MSLPVGLALLLRLDRHLWFFGDDWEFLLRRGLHHPEFSIWKPHNEHWSTVPILIYRFLYTILGLHHYLIYLLPVLIAHLVVVHCVWRLALRAGGRPWVATTGATVLLLFGPGAEDLTWAFQVGFVGSVAFGLIAIAVATRPKPRPTWDFVASVMLILSLASSSIGDAMLIGTAVAIWCTRSWQRSIAIVAGPLVAYVIWYGLIGWTGAQSDHLSANLVLGIPAFAANLVSDALGSAVGLPAAGATILVLVLVWLVRHAADRRELGGVIGAAAASGAFALLISLGRAQFGTSPASRYIYVLAGCLLPAALVAISEIGGRSAQRAVVLVLAAVMIADAGDLRMYAASRSRAVLATEDQVRSAYASVAAGSPGINPTPVPADPDISLGYLRKLVDRHALALTGAGSVQPTELARMNVVLQSRGGEAPAARLIGWGGVPQPTIQAGCIGIDAGGVQAAVQFAFPSGGGGLQLAAAQPITFGVEAEGGLVYLTTESVTEDLVTDLGPRQPVTLLVRAGSDVRICGIAGR